LIRTGKDGKRSRKLLGKKIAKKALSTEKECAKIKALLMDCCG